MKRLIAAVLTATTMTLAACTATAGIDPTTAPGTGTSSTVLVAPTSTGPTTTDPIESWLSGAETTAMTPTGSSTVSSSATGIDDPTTATTTAVTGDVYDAIPVTIPSTITGIGLQAADAAIPVWRNAVRVLDESLQDPGGKEWKSAVYRYVNDPAAITQTSLIDTFVKQGTHQVGETGYTAEVVGAVEHNVQIKACVDLSKYDVVDADGQSVLKPGTPSRFSRTFSISFYSDHDPATWLLNDIKTPNPVKPC